MHRGGYAQIFPTCYKKRAPKNQSPICCLLQRRPDRLNCGFFPNLCLGLDLYGDLHAKFVFRDGQWRVTGLGRNGLMVNEMPVRSEQVVRDGDLISWGSQPGALVSRVQIGPA